MTSERPRLLLVEDNPADSNLVEEALAEAHLECDLSILRNGAQAMDYIAELDSGSRQASPHLVLLDLNLPKVSGAEVLERVRSSPKCGSVKVFIISSSDAPADREQAMRLGASYYFRKPSNLAEFMTLGAKVRAVLES